ncbi:pyocin knob domain-containing protein [Acinetobacter johnsonii]|uniref:Pyocin knob domain-containing protein n=1 Tax=Acinetobacter johnsonii TaxID=40214 RepID=A0AAW6RQC9_ACIJO|nr:pyocin knob domain-containing protein [Acinetobacter johnsonii]MDG9785848.1 pyocin knob domain-containing protein [Acinetobacter johnsonii]MDG9797893.1 pyocin knob domain-containing protein [Acinetobacter johnsonii]
MAKQTINQGTAPTGAGGDTFRTGSAKLQANDDELYAALGANPAGVLPTQPSLTKSNEWQASQKIKLSYPSLQLESTIGDYGTLIETSGTYPSVYVRPKATMSSNTGQIASFNFPGKTGNHTIACTSDIAGMLVKGNYGIGARSTDGVLGSANLNSLPSNIGFEARIQNLLVNGTTANNYPVNGSYGALIRYDSDTHGFQQFYLAGGTKIYARTMSSGAFGAWVEFKTSGNTTVDANGFIKNASPIVQLFSDKIELNDEAKQQEINFEKLGIGDYVIKGSSGFAQEGWYIETPKDANGNVLFSVIYTTLENGDISVKTYKKKFDFETVSIVADLDNPVDITENRWIDLRLQELPQPEIEIPESVAPPDFQPTGLAEAVATIMESYNDAEQ